MQLTLGFPLITNIRLLSVADDTEWEPIETYSTAVEPIRSPVTVSMQELAVAEWPELITKVTTLGSVAPFEVP